MPHYVDWLIVTGIAVLLLLLLAGMYRVLLDWRRRPNRKPPVEEACWASESKADNHGTPWGDVAVQGVFPCQISAGEHHDTDLLSQEIDAFMAEEMARQERLFPDPVPPWFAAPSLFTQFLGPDQPNPRLDWLRACDAARQQREANALFRLNAALPDIKRRVAAQLDAEVTQP